MMGALGSALLATEANAQTYKDNDGSSNRMEQSVKQDWTWGTDVAALRLSDSNIRGFEGKIAKNTVVIHQKF